MIVISSGLDRDGELTFNWDGFAELVAESLNFAGNLAESLFKSG